jgi:hypothetical protein
MRYKTMQAEIEVLKVGHCASFVYAAGHEFFKVKTDGLKVYSDTKPFSYRSGNSNYLKRDL